MSFTKVNAAGIGTTQPLTLSGANLSGVITASGLYVTGISTFTGNVSIGGTLTYEDTTNVDSIGLITARNGIQITGGSGLDLTGSSGIITATTYKVGAAVTISSGGVEVAGVTTTQTLRVGTAVTISSGGIHVLSGITTVSAGTTSAPSITPLGDNNTGIFFPSADTIAFAEGGAEAARFDSSGRFGLGTNAPNYELQINASDAVNVIQLTNTSTGATAADGLLIYNNGVNAFISNEESGFLKFQTAGAERAQIDASGRLLVGTSTARANFFNTTLTAGLQVEGTGGGTARGALSVVNNDSSNNPALLILGRSGTASLSSNTVVTNDDLIGTLSFQGADGTEFVEAARIRAEVDGTPGANDMPGRIVFSTTADSASSATERFRITNDGVLAHDQPAPAAVNATATLTVANLKTGIITSTSAAATDMTLPTGTDTEAGFSGVYTNMTFEWSVINTGPSLVRVLAGTAHTIVGSGSVATGTSGRFASRRTAANTFVTYRLS